MFQVSRDEIALSGTVTLRGCGGQDAAIGEGAVGIDQAVVIADPAAIDELFLSLMLIVETNEVLPEVERVRWSKGEVVGALLYRYS